MLDVQGALQKLRKAGVTQREVAQEIGVSQQTVSVWEREGLPERFNETLRVMDVIERVLKRRLAEIEANGAGADPSTPEAS